MTAGSAVTIESIGTHLQRIGYHAGLLKWDYCFSDKTVPLVGFADRTFDARSACIAVIDVPTSNQDELESQVQGYQKLGAPVVFVCQGNELQWLCVTTSKVLFQEKAPAERLTNFFDEHKDDFSPLSIYRAKTLARLDPGRHQLHFVDIGLMPLLENDMGERLAGLIKRMIDALYGSLGKPRIDNTKGKWLFQSAFWLLAARILRDKEVNGFVHVDFNDAAEVRQRVQRHYHAEQSLETYSKRQLKALESAAEIVSDFGSLRNMTIESLAYVYENTLINKEVRRALGIHATPSYLVDYIVWQLAGWISEIPQEERYVLEPTCGHAPFLVSAARLLREMTDINDNKKLHQYLKDHLMGIEVDAFAREIARLSLTLADVPNPNGWQLKSADVFDGKILQDMAKQSMILLCNPPFQDFSRNEKNQYKHDTNLAYNNKSVEILGRTLPLMPEGSVFGVIVPRSFLMKGKNSASLRKVLVENYEIREIGVFPDNVFKSADHETAVILGRKRISNVISNKIKYIRVREHTLDEFKASYNASTEVVQQSIYLDNEDPDLEIPEHKPVWDYCQNYGRLYLLVDIKKTGKGLEYKRKINEEEKTGQKRKGLFSDNITYSEIEFPNSIKGFVKFYPKIKIYQTPKTYFMTLDSEIIRRFGQGKPTNKAQILLNSTPVSRGPWRLKAFIDRKGYPFTSSFIAIRPKSKNIPLEVFWTMLNSPLANAYIYCHGTKRLIGVDRILNMPIPDMSDKDFHHICELVHNYLNLYNVDKNILTPDVNRTEARKRMWAIDAEVMRLYNLPPRLERQVLDLFNGWPRKGVDFEQERYYPEGFDSWIPLHEYLSEEFQRSTVSFVKDWVEKVRSPEIIKALEVAVEAFSEEE